MKEVRCNVKTGQGKVTLKKKEEPGKWNDVEKLTYRQWQIVWQYLILNFNSRINSQVNTPNFEVHPNEMLSFLVHSNVDFIDFNLTNVIHLCSQVILHGIGYDSQEDIQHSIISNLTEKTLLIR